MKIRCCRLLTLKIRLFTVFSIWKTTFVQIGHGIFLKNNHKSSDYRADHLRQMRYLHVDSFFSKI